MKKLIITTMAAVSLAFCAKATLTEETFESYSEGSLFGTYTDEEDGVEKYRVLDGWYTEPTLENLFTVTNIANYVGAGTYPEKADRPSKSDSVKALAIDTSAPLLRYADSSEGSQSLSDAPIFFDSVVQFTATDVAPSMENNTTDKLAVWLYTSPDDVSATNPGLFGETLPITKVAVTAGYLDGATLKTKNYITNIDVEPDTWHRLTIKSFVKSGRPWYSVWVDKTPVNGKADINAEEGLTEFLSMVSDGVNSDTYTTLQGVAFDGKGAVDDIVFTTTAPEFTKEPEGPTVDTYAITTAGENAEFTVLDSEGEELDAGKLDVEITTVGIAVKPAPGYVLQSAIFNGNAIEDLPSFDPTTKDYYFEINVPNTDGVVAKGSEFAFSVVMVANSGVVTVGSTTVKFDDNGKITNITTANNGQVVTGEITDDMFADYYAVSVVDGKLVIALDPEVAEPTIDETAVDKGDAIVVTETEVALGVTNAKAGLWYGAQAYSDAACTTKIGDEPTGWEKATGETVTVTATKPEGDKAFFKVVVDDQDHSSEEQN